MKLLALKLLKSKLGLRRLSLLPSQLTLIPIATYLYSKGIDKIESLDHNDIENTLTWLIIAKLGNGLVLDRDVIGAINIGLRYLSSDGRGMAFPSTGPHEVRVKLVIPYQGPAPLTELKLIKSN
ncbi:MAG: hypothetical protein QXU36_05990 [Thermofilum sp.]|uniref:hypothetical protein n=1 Tax=Thermoprotei TaxID=183924 RepID=UPI0031624427